VPSEEDARELRAEAAMIRDVLSTTAGIEVPAFES
jgi:hypothetical protein